MKAILARQSKGSKHGAAFSHDAKSASIPSNPHPSLGLLYYVTVCIGRTLKSLPIC